MPIQPTAAQIRLDNILTALSAAVATFEVVAASLKAPFLEPISNIMRSLLAIVQAVKKNNDDFTRMLEQIHELLYEIIRLHMAPDTGGELSPEMLNHLGKFTETLHKIHTFVEAQQEKSRIKKFFRQGEMSTLLKGCKTGLEEALETLKVQGIHSLRDMTSMQQYIQKTHQEVLELISSHSDGGSSTRTSSMLSTPQNSSNSLSLLPSEPQIFHGRESEVSDIIQSFHQNTPRIAILGGGGMGKTSLARAVLHHTEITTRYLQRRIFVACDTTSTSVQLAALIGAHLGLNPEKDSTQKVVHTFSSSSPSLLVLDNLETVWEPMESRGEVEKLLSLLADVDHLALIITMRGAERPANIQWTRPFLGPLKPLSQDAARKTFIDIADEGHTTEDIDNILLLADSMPLAINLIAHLVDYEGFPSVFHRWETEKTSLLSDGHDKGSNLDLSISLSLKSPRLTSVPHTRELLSLLSILPDGLSDIDLLQSKLPVDNILTCKATLLATSLAYTDVQKRLKSLAPIREYMQKIHPPGPHIVLSIQKHFHKLLEIHEAYVGTVSGAALTARITSNFSNIQSVLLHGLNPDNPDIISTIYSTFYFDSAGQVMCNAQSPLIYQIPNLLPHPIDHRLEVYFIKQLFTRRRFHPISNPDGLIQQAIKHFTCFDDPDLECTFYNIIGTYYRIYGNDIPKAMWFFEAGMALSISTGNTKKQSQLLCTLAEITWQASDYSRARVHAYESQRLAKISGNLLGEAEALRIECICLVSIGNYSWSISLANRARELLGLCGMSCNQLDYDLMNTLGEVHRLKSEYAEGRKIYNQMLQNVSIEKNEYQHAIASLNIAQIDVEIGASRVDVQCNITLSRLFFTTTSNSLALIFCDTTQSALHVREGEFLEAKSLLLPCLGVAWGQSSEVVSYCLEKLGDIRHWRSSDLQSSTWTIIFLAHSLKLKEKLGIYKAFQFLGDMYQAEGDQQTATSLFTIALDGFTQMDVHRSRAECMLQLGDILNTNGDMTKAADFWRTARPLFERSSQESQIALIDERLAGITLDHIEGHKQSLVYLSGQHASRIRPANTPVPEIEETRKLVLKPDTGFVLVPA